MLQAFQTTVQDQHLPYIYLMLYIYIYAPYHLCNLLAVDDALPKLDTDDHRINFHCLLDIVSVE